MPEKTKVKSTPQPSPLAANTTFEISLSWSEVAPVYTKTLNKLAKRIKLPGFRPGMVPAKMAEEEIGHDALVEETLREVLPTKYAEALKKNKYLPLTDPEFSAKTHLHKGEDWTIVVQIAEKPVVELKQCEKTVTAAIKQAKAEYINKLADANKAASEKKTTQKDQTVEKQPASTLTPDQEKARAERAEQEFVLNAIFSELIKTTEVKVPELLVKLETRHQLEDLTRQLKNYNMSLDQYLERQKMNFDQMANSMATQALAQLQLSFILEAVRQQAEIEVTEAEIDQAFQSADAQTAKQAKNDYVRQSIQRSLISRKLETHLLSLG